MEKLKDWPTWYPAGKGLGRAIREVIEVVEYLRAEVESLRKRSYPQESYPQAAVKKRAGPFDPSLMELPEWLDRSVWVEWVADRKARGKSISERGAKMQFAKLEVFRKGGLEPKTIIEHSIACGFQGLFAPTGKPVFEDARRTAPPSTASVDEARRWLAEQRERSIEVEARRLERKKAGKPIHEPL